MVNNVEIINEIEQERFRKDCWKKVEKEFSGFDLKVSRWVNDVIINKKKRFFSQTEAGVYQTYDGQFLLRIMDKKLLEKFKKICSQSEFKWVIKVGDSF